VKKFRDAKYEPAGYTLFTYAAVKVWADAAKKAKSIEAAKVAAALRTGTYRLRRRPLTYDQKGDIKTRSTTSMSGRAASPTGDQVDARQRRGPSPALVQGRRPARSARAFCGFQRFNVLCRPPTIGGQRDMRPPMWYPGLNL
jgi:hypothetical protein